MKNKSKILSVMFKLFLVLMISLGIFAQGTKAFAASNDPNESRAVSLLNVNYESHYGRLPGQSISGQVLVKNLAYAKIVTIHYSHNGIDWFDAPATYNQQAAYNNEVWDFKISEGIDIGRKYIFAIKYEVNGQVYWDNNNGQNYIVEGKEENL